MKKKSRVLFTEIARSITGISTPVFGISWNPPESKREIVRSLVTFLEDRRSLYSGYDMEYGPWVSKSIIEIRTELTNILKNCPDDEDLTGPIRAMRAACRKFLDQMGHPSGRGHMFNSRGISVWQSLGELRGVFGLHLARLCAAYGIDVEPELASIFPNPDDQTNEND